MEGLGIGNFGCRVRDRAGGVRFALKAAIG